MLDLQEVRALRFRNGPRGERCKSFIYKGLWRCFFWRFPRFLLTAFFIYKTPSHCIIFGGGVSRKKPRKHFRFFLSWGLDNSLECGTMWAWKGRWDEQTRLRPPSVGKFWMGVTTTIRTDQSIAESFRWRVTKTLGSKRPLSSKKIWLCSISTITSTIYSIIVIVEIEHSQIFQMKGCKDPRIKEDLAMFYFNYN